jgi:amino acid transporter
MGEGVATHRPFKIIALFPDDEAQTAPAGELRRRSAATSQVAPGILPAASRVFFVYLGFEKIANMTEEVRNPARNIPVTILRHVTTTLYALAAIGSRSWACGAATRFRR